MLQTANFPKTLVLVSVAIIQYARDDEEPYFCINQNKNVENNDLYSNSNMLATRAISSMIGFSERILAIRSTSRAKLRSSSKFIRIISEQRPHSQLS